MKEFSVTRSIGGVSEASQEAGTASSEVLNAAGELTNQTAVLKRELEKFLAQVRSA